LAADFFTTVFEGDLGASLASFSDFSWAAGVVSPK
jgi:hypothetical protein